jgi:YHS domain-containing protein
MCTIPITCHKCGKESQKPKPEIDRQRRKGKTHFFCSLSCAQSFNKHTTTEVDGICLYCKKEFLTSTHKRFKKCCSLKCAKLYAQSKVNYSLRKPSVRKKNYPITKIFTCFICGNDFNKSIKYKAHYFCVCSKVCGNTYLKELAIDNPNCGGETGYRHYQYNGVWMDSSWEVDLAKWMDEENIKWDRSRKRHMFWWTDDRGIKRRYYPDFYLPTLDVYADPKNKYKCVQDAKKLENVIRENQITLLWGDLENIKNEIDNLRKSGNMYMNTAGGGSINKPEPLHLTGEADPSEGHSLAC